MLRQPDHCRKRHAAARRQLRPFVGHGDRACRRPHHADLRPEPRAVVLGRTWCDHGAAAGTGAARRARTVAAADGRAAATGIFLCAAADGRAAAARIFLCDVTTVTAGRLPAAPATATGLSLRSAATGPDTGRDARHRGGLPDAKAGGGDAATAAAGFRLWFWPRPGVAFWGR